MSGKQLEESGVLSESLLSRSNSWGLHMPLVCPDGAVVAYAWKRQLAGQAGASAVDRTRLVETFRTYLSRKNSCSRAWIGKNYLNLQVHSIFLHIA